MHNYIFQAHLNLTVNDEAKKYLMYMYFPDTARLSFDIKRKCSTIDKYSDQRLLFDIEQKGLQTIAFIFQPL